MGYQFFKLERTEQITTVIIDKPPMNTLDGELYRERDALCDELDGDNGTRAIVFGSRNPKVFIAGADIKEMTTYRFEAELIENSISTVHKALHRVTALKTIKV